MRVNVHPAADAFPMMNAEQYEGLKADITERGQQEAIVYWQGQLIDGRNRLKACQELNIEPTECELDESTDPVAYVISANLHRRHLTDTQRAMVASALANMKRGARTDLGPNGTMSIADAAKLCNTSDRSTKRAKQVRDKGSKDLVQAVERNEVSLNQAVNLIKAVESKSEQSKIVREGKKSVEEKIKEAKEKTPPKTRKAKAHDVEPEPEYEDIDEPEACKWDMAVINTFRKCECRLGTLRQLLSELSETEIQILKDWLA